MNYKIKGTWYKMSLLPKCSICGCTLPLSEIGKYAHYQQHKIRSNQGDYDI